MAWKSITKTLNRQSLVGAHLSQKSPESYYPDTAADSGQILIRFSTPSSSMMTPWTVPDPYESAKLPTKQSNNSDWCENEDVSQTVPLRPPAQIETPPRQRLLPSHLVEQHPKRQQSTAMATPLRTRTTFVPLDCEGTGSQKRVLCTS